MVDGELTRLQLLERGARSAIAEILNFEKELGTVTSYNFQSTKPRLVGYIDLYLKYLDSLARALEPHSNLARLIQSRGNISTLVSRENVEAEQRRWNAVALKIKGFKGEHNRGVFILPLEWPAFVEEMKKVAHNIILETELLRKTLEQVVLNRRAKAA